MSSIQILLVVDIKLRFFLELVFICPHSALKFVPFLFFIINKDLFHEPCYLFLSIIKNGLTLSFRKRQKSRLCDFYLKFPGSWRKPFGLFHFHVLTFNKLFLWFNEFLNQLVIIAIWPWFFFNYHRLYLTIEYTLLNISIILEKLFITKRHKRLFFE